MRSLSPSPCSAEIDLRFERYSAPSDSQLRSPFLRSVGTLSVGEVTAANVTAPTDRVPTDECNVRLERDGRGTSHRILPVASSSISRRSGKERGTAQSGIEMPHYKVKAHTSNDCAQRRLRLNSGRLITAERDGYLGTEAQLLPDFAIEFAHPTEPNRHKTGW